MVLDVLIDTVPRTLEHDITEENASVLTGMPRRKSARKMTNQPMSLDMRIATGCAWLSSLPTSRGEEVSLSRANHAEQRSTALYRSMKEILRGS